MQTAKSGIRVLGIAESFVRGAARSVFAGVVMRKDLVIDGIAFSSATVGGMDATDAAFEVYSSLCRRDIHCIMLSGCVVSWFNIINIDDLCKKTGLPVVCITYEKSQGLSENIMHHFPGDEKRLFEYERAGKRMEFFLKNGHEIFLRTSGISYEDAGWLCNAFLRDGKIPEPLRVARLTARASVRQKIREGARYN